MFFHSYLPWTSLTYFPSHNPLLPIFFPHQTVCCPPNVSSYVSEQMISSAGNDLSPAFCLPGAVTSDLFKTKFKCLLWGAFPQIPTNNCRFFLGSPPIYTLEWFSFSYGTVWVIKQTEINGRLCTPEKPWFLKWILFPLLRGSFGRHQPVPGNGSEFMLVLILPVPGLLCSSFLGSDFISR